MTIRPGSEFNIVGAPSEELKRHLLYLASIDSDSVLSGYKSTNPMRTGAESGKAGEADAFMTFAQAVMASQERIDALADKLTMLDQASYHALIETEEQLEQARRELEDIRDQAYEITLQDGTLVKVYRDGNIVRSDTGEVVGPEIIVAADIPSEAPDWAKRVAAGERVDALEAQREQIILYREKLHAARDTLSGSPSDQDLDDLEAELDNMPAAVKRHHGALSSEEVLPNDPDRSTSFATTLTGPAFDATHKTQPAFNQAVQDHSPESTAERPPEHPEFDPAP